MSTNTATADLFASISEAFSQTVAVTFNSTVTVDDAALPEGVTADNHADCLVEALGDLLADFGIYEANATLTIG